MVEKVTLAVSIDEHQVEKDAERFKEFIESRVTKTVGWRGDVDAG